MKAALTLGKSWESGGAVTEPLARRDTFVLVPLPVLHASASALAPSIIHVTALRSRSTSQFRHGGRGAVDRSRVTQTRPDSTLLGASPLDPP